VREVRDLRRVAILAVFLGGTWEDGMSMFQLKE
jgi:hypothetical protein